MPQKEQHNPSIAQMDMLKRIENLRRDLKEMLLEDTTRKGHFSGYNMERYYHEGRADAFGLAIQRVNYWLS